MSKIPQGILGGMSGKIGGVVGSSWKGINVLKTKPLSVANPNTAEQIAQRTKFSNSVAFSKQILSDYIKPLWDRFAGQMSGFNAFIKANITEFEGEVPLSTGNFVLAQGRMSPTSVDDLNIVAGDTVLTVTWPDDSGTGFKLTDDEVFAIAINETKKQLGKPITIKSRADLSIDVNLPEPPETGDIVTAYLCFRRMDGTVVSQTSKLSETVA
ncbi:MAG TPA: DUF6266 family protein [Bacteroidales bacterium]|nr:DUF6266 family protein [Bacteroidales bacterium]